MILNTKSEKCQFLGANLMTLGYIRYQNCFFNRISGHTQPIEPRCEGADAGAAEIWDLTHLPNPTS